MFNNLGKKFKQMINRFHINRKKEIPVIEKPTIKPKSKPYKYGIPVQKIKHFGTFAPVKRINTGVQN